MKLKNCPFCGSELEYDHPDCIYPKGKPEYNEETDELYYPLWQITCHVGNCGAILLGDSKEDCVKRWNVRYN